MLFRSSWRAGASRQAIVEFVQRVTAEGSPEFVPAEERVAVFDNDGTLWCEQPMPIQLDFILRRLAAMADQDPSLRGPPALAGRLHQGLRLAGPGHHQALPRRRQRAAGAGRRSDNRKSRILACRRVIVDEMVA